MPSLRDFLPARYSEIEAEAADIAARARALDVELRELRRVAESVGIQLPGSGNDVQLGLLGSVDDTRSKGIASEAAVKEAVVAILGELGHGLTAADLLPRLNARLAINYPKTSLSPQLSRLKSEGRLTLDNTVWSLAGPPASGAHTVQPPNTRQALINMPAVGSSKMAEHWLSVLWLMTQRYPGVVTNDELMQFARERGYRFTRHALRATLYGWRCRDYIAATGVDGQHTIAPKGAAIFGHDLSKSKAEGPARSAEPSLEFGGG